MSQRYVKVVATGYFVIDEKDLRSSYNATTFEEALDNQRQWHKDDPDLPFQDYVDVEKGMTFELMPEGFKLED